MTSLRLSPEMERNIASFAKMKNQTKSALIITALEEFFKQEEEELDSYTLGEQYFGKYGSKSSSTDEYKISEGPALYAADVDAGNLSRDYKKLLKGKISAKYRTS
ncbi:hypothetical protein AGMMS50212_14150 [Spirochaetia bacterium]|nr:hypothetical protein AGMMS50212_14150 [Spirochaetia bacterium]